MAAVELATGYIALVPSAKNITAGLMSELGSPVEAAAAQSGSRASAALSGRFSAGTKGMGAKLGKTIGAGLLGGGGLAVAGVGLLAHLGATLDSANDIIRSKTGQGGAVLKGLDKSFQNVFKTVPASADDVATALSSINQRLGITGKPLEALTRQVLELSHVTGTDLQTNLSGIVPLLTQWNVKGSATTGVVDEIFRASQKSGVAVADLSSQLVGSGVQLRAAGFDLSKSVGLLALLGKSGLSASDVVPAISKSLAAAAKAGKPAAKFFHDTFEQIRTDSNLKAPADAIAVFGTRAGPKLAALIRSGKLSYEQFTKSISKGDTVAKAAKDTFDWQEKLGILKNKLSVVVAPAAAAVFNGIGTGADIAGAAMGKAFGPGGIGTRALTGIRTLLGRVDFGAIFDKGRAAVSAALPSIEKAFNQVVSSVSKIDFGTIFTKASQLIPPLVTAIGAIAAAVLKLAAGAIPILVEGFKTGFSIVVRVMPAVITGLRVIAAVTTFLAQHLQGLKPVLFAVAGGFVALKVVRTVQAGILGVAKAAGTAVGTFQKWAGKIGDVVKGARSTVSVIGNAAKTAGTFAKQAIQAAIGTARQTAAFIAQKAAAVAAAVAQKAMAAAQWLLNAAMDANPVTLIVIGIAALAAAVVLAYQHFAPFRAVVDAVGRAFATVARVVMTAVVGAFNWIKNNWKLLFAILTGPFGLAVVLIRSKWSTITAVVAGVFNWIKRNWPLLLAILTGPIGLAVLAITKNWDTIKSGVGTVFGAVKRAFDHVVSFVSGLPKRIGTAAAGLFDGIKDAFKSAINFVIDGWNSLHFGLPKINTHIPGIGKIGGVSFGVPQIPRLSGGGVFTDPTLALVGETTKARPEITTPAALMRSIVGSELNKSDRGRGGVTVKQEITMRHDVATAADLEYAGRKLAFALNNTGRRP